MEADVIDPWSGLLKGVQRVSIRLSCEYFMIFMSLVTGLSVGFFLFEVERLQR